VASFTHATTGVIVSVADEKDLGPDWVPADDETSKKRTTRSKKSDES
jgi:hypothetical protein